VTGTFGLPHVVLAPGRERRVRGGHPWVFATEVARVQGVPEPGDIVDVITARGGFLGRGYINPASQILVRLLTRRPDEAVDEEFFRRRVREAVEYRVRLLAAGALAASATPDPARRAFRLVFAESDGLPALVVDYFAGVLVFQALALGVDRRKELLLRLVREEASRHFRVAGVWERDDAPVRELEGLPLTAGPFWGDPPPRVTIREGGLDLVVDLERGQKTGYFLDQSANRAAAAAVVRAAAGGPRVLDCFCYTGAFALAAARAGAAEVVGVDTSAEALELARENAALNGFSGPDDPAGPARATGPGEGPRVSFVEANVFDFLRQEGAQGRRWDVVLLDPPAFAKNRAALPGALRGYKEINLRAMRLIPPGGYLVTSSCSQHLSEELFLEVLADAAADTRRRVRVAEVRGQAADHPFLPAAPETRYLKTVVLRVD